MTWSFGDGANGAGSEASHSYSRAGDYTVVETVIDSNGLAAHATHSITVAPLSRLLAKLMPLG